MQHADRDRQQRRLHHEVDHRPAVQRDHADEGDQREQPLPLVRRPPVVVPEQQVAHPAEVEQDHAQPGVPAVEETPHPAHADQPRRAGRRAAVPSTSAVAITVAATSAAQELSVRASGFSSGCPRRACQVNSTLSTP